MWTFLTGLLTLFLLRAAGVDFLPLLLWGMTAIASELALPLWPKAGHLAMAGAALGIFGIRKFQGESLSLFIWTTGLGLLLSFCRPEFMAAACAGILFLLPAACFSVSRKFSAVSAIPLVAGIA